jgi:hypothetical protein
MGPLGGGDGSVTREVTQGEDVFGSCLSLTVESWGIHTPKGDGSGWLRWLLKHGRVILTPEIISWT